MDDEIIPPVREQKRVEYVNSLIKDDIIIHRNGPVAAQVSTLPIALSTVANFSNKVPMPEVRGFSMRKAMTVLRQAGLKIQIQGSGKVIWQSPKPGSILNKGSTCIVGLK
jgi:beta-lactam-binding protein with PASTA domain